jgi:Uma2 family endonuclease
MTTASTNQQLLTAADLLRLDSQGVKGELVRGVLCETMSAGGEHSEIAAALSAALVNHVRPLRLGRISTSDAGVRLERDPDTVREPDVAYFSAETLPLDVKVRGYYEIVPDLVVEIVSPNDQPVEVAERVAMWQGFGVALVWAVYPVARMVAAHPLDGPAIIFTEDDTLDGGTVLPEFRCTVSDVLDW